MSINGLQVNLDRGDQQMLINDGTNSNDRMLQCCYMELYSSPAPLSCLNAGEED